MAKVTINRFKSYDISNDEIKTSRPRGTKAAIEEVSGQPLLLETAVEVDSSTLGHEVVRMHYFISCQLASFIDSGSISVPVG